MGLNIKFDNSSIVADSPEVAVLRTPVAAGSSVILNLDNNSGFVQNGYVLIEDIATAHAEIAKVNASVVAGTQIQVDTLLFPHNVGVKVTKIAYNQVKFYRSATPTGLKTLLSTNAIDADNEFTEYNDTVNTTGYAFFTLYNSTSTAESDYSSAFPYSTLKLSSKGRIRDFVKGFYKKGFSEDVFDMLLQAAEDEIFSIYPWRFRENTVTFSSVANQKDYPFEDYGVVDFGTLAYVTCNGDPVEIVTFKENEILNWGTLIASYPRVAHIWNDVLTFTPAPEGIYDVVVKYWKNAPGFSEETTDTAIIMPQIVSYGILQELWAMDDTQKSQYWEKKKVQTIALLKKRNKKQSVRFAPLSNAPMVNTHTRDQFDYPSITV